MSMNDTVWYIFRIPYGIIFLITTGVANMYEIFGTAVSEWCVYGAIIGSAIGAVVTAFWLYVVANIKHNTDMQDAINEARISGAEYPQYKIEKSKTWFKGYTYAMVIDIVFAVAIGVAGAIVCAHRYDIGGAIEFGTIGAIVAIVAGFVIDVKIIHPIADNKFMDIETAIVDKITKSADECAENTETKNISDALQILELINKLKK